MKKRKYSLLAIVLFVIHFLTQNKDVLLAQTSSVHLYEAETAQSDRLTFLEDSIASSGKFLRMGDSGRITWNVLTDTSQWYELSFRYRAFDGEKEEYIVRNGYQYAVGFGLSNEWSFFRTQTFLQQGANTVELKASWGNIDIDYLAIAPVNINPTIKPLHNIFYREFPRDLFFKINRFGHQIQSITCGSQNIRFEISGFPDYEDAVMVRVPREEIMKLTLGNNRMQIHFDSTYSGEVLVHLVEKGKHAELTIVAPDISHGASVLMILPTNKVMLVDCGQAQARDSVVIPLLHRLGIDTIDYFIITHYHADHDSGDKGKKIINLFHVGKFLDYQSFRTGDEFNLEGTHIKILNSYNDGEEENTRSLSLKMEYNGFVYVHGGDTYDGNQKTIMKRFPNDVEADVFYANHHFHGSVDVDYLRAVNPVIVLLQAQGAIYARSAYMEKFKKETEGYLVENKKRYIEDLPALEVGMVIVRVHSGSQWTYETYKSMSKEIPYIFK